MTWFRIDDGWANHPKVRRAGKDGRSLWVMTGNLCSGAGTDGLVDPLLVRESYAPLAGVAPAKSKLLVDADLWHNADNVADCQRCVDHVAGLGDRHGVVDATLERGWWLFHDWSDYQQPSGVRDDPIVKLAAKRARQLRKSQPGKELQEVVRRRDRDMCRYCGRQVVFGTQDRRSPRFGTFDHVDPFDFSSGFGGNSKSNVVVACNECNGRKGQRTPEQWVAAEPDDGRLLAPAPGRRKPRPDQGRTKDEPRTDQRTGADSAADISETDQGFSSRDARPGTGLGLDRGRALVGTCSGSGPGTGPDPSTMGET